MTEPMTDARLDEIEARLKAATPGDWYIDPDGDLGKHTLASTHAGYTLVGEFDTGAPISDRPNPDATFVEHATRDMTELVAEVRRLREELADARRARNIVTLNEARDIAHAEALRLEGHNLDYSRGARCVAYLLTRAIRTAEADRLRAQLAAKEA